MPEAPAPAGGMSAKLGPLKAWQWLVIAGVAVLAYYWWQRQKAAEAAATPASASTTTDDSDSSATSEDAAYDALANALDSQAQQLGQEEQRSKNEHHQIAVLEKEQKEDEHKPKPTAPKKGHVTSSALTAPLRNAPPGQPAVGATQESSDGTMMQPTPHSPTSEATGRHAGSAQPTPPKTTERPQPAPAARR